MIAIASDCYDESANIQRGIGALRARGHDVMLFHVFDAAERDFPYDAPDTFADLESDARLAIKPEEVRGEYRAAFQAHREEVQRRVGADGADYLAIASDEPLDRALRGWLEHRRSPELGR